jgi:hypothetical protein
MSTPRAFGLEILSDNDGRWIAGGKGFGKEFGRACAQGHALLALV